MPSHLYLEIKRIMRRELRDMGESILKKQCQDIGLDPDLLAVVDLDKLAGPLSRAIIVFTGKEKADRIIREIDKFKALEELAMAEGIAGQMSRRKRLDALKRLGDICNLTGEWEGSLEYLSKALELARDAPAVRFDIMASMASVNLEMGRMEDARRILENALDGALRERDAESVAGINRVLGKMHWRNGEFDSSIEACNAAMEHYLKKDDRNSLAYIYKDLGDVYGEKGEHDKGLEFYGKSMAMFDPKLDLYNIANINMNMGVIHSMKKDWRKAARHYEICIEYTEREGYLNTMAWALFNVAEAYTKIKELDRAEKALKRSAELLERTDDTMGMAGVHMKFGELLQERKRYADAVPHFQECIRTLRELGIPKYLADATHELGLTYAKMGKGEEARKQFWEALVLYEKMGNARNVEMVRKDIASLGEPDQ